MDKNVVWHQPTVTRDRRAKNNGHKSVILWFTGLSGAGKSTIAHALEESLHKVGANTYVLDGDNVRHGLCGDLGFSDTDRNENIRRIGEVSKLFIDAGVIALSAFISPFRADRQRARDLVDEGDFIEIHVKCPLEVCETRDPKGLYKKARAGLIKGYTGISSPYEEPEKPEIVIDTSENNIDQCVEIIIEYLTRKQIIVPATLDRSASC
ncbi:adenylyl-sulfate kinase [Sedimenticola sp.]|uniref:adenylyl-sulfate kinase n=1 Tax=Sedimenticola sp. TaxID=1940285 RepID=UPI002587AE77|nr:adenylyl-sulfate kinase [Sedimenticola sp.]MCW8903290.1 adenylyl-sulfate kinase [Sedimenticola sp.]